MSEVHNSSEKSGDMVINEKTIEALIVRFIPTSQYFEKRFDHLEGKLDYKFEVLNDKFKHLEASLHLVFQSLLRCFNLLELVAQYFEFVVKLVFQMVETLLKVLRRGDEPDDEGFDGLFVMTMSPDFSEEFWASLMLTASFRKSSY